MRGLTTFPLLNVMHLRTPSFVQNGMLFSPKSLICSTFAATNFFGDVLRSSLTCGFPVDTMLADPLHSQLTLRRSHCHLRTWRTGFCFLLFCTKLQCVLSCRTSNTFCCLPCHLSLPFLPLPFCQEFFPPSLPPLPPFSFQF